MKKLTLFAIAFVSLSAAAADKADKVDKAAWQPLLDASLSKFDVYLSYRGDQIMSVLKGTAPPELKPLGLNPPGRRSSVLWSRAASRCCTSRASTTVAS